MRNRCALTAALLLALTGAAGPALAAPSAAPAPGSAAYVERDVRNIQAAFGRGVAQLQEPGYLTSVARDALELELADLAAQATRPDRPALTLGNAVPEGVGNPDRDGWSGTRGQITPVSFPAYDGALLQGHLFTPLPHARDPYTHRKLHAPYPSVVIVTGSIQASAGVYRWLAEDLAERGYAALTFDVQGQGQSETLPHNGSLDGVPSEQQDSFDHDTEDAITWMLSTPKHRYRGGTFNPRWRQVDHRKDHHSVTEGRTRKLAVIGHSTGAVTVSYLQGVDRRIQTAVALDKLTATPSAIDDDKAEIGDLPGPVKPAVPTLGLQAEYGFEPQPYFLANCSSFEPCQGSPDKAPDPNREEATGFDTFRAHHVDTAVIVPRASTHLDFTDLPPILPSSALGQAMISYYMQQWLALYLQHKPQAARAMRSTTIRYLMPGRGDVRRPIAFDRNSHLSFYFCSGFAFRDLAGHEVADGDLTHVGCH
ncbi:MAG TPA: alpha/beta hydrolase [Mycobacteriales bacterium]|nr:alpha/beta hydrolase [Mycobacteriales bacterium]